jgi:Mlc titration factor MtfA (ptsG expression regulator)
MWNAISRWRRRRILRRAVIPDELWDEALALRPFVSIYTADELRRLREKVVLFLHAKGIVGAQGHEVTPLQRVVIALEACVLVLELDMAFYDGFENVIVYPGEFVPDWEWEDEAGVVHRNDEPMAGEAMPGGPVVLSWPDVAAGADWQATGMNLVIHEFAHKIDMRNGEADGCPPLPTACPSTPGRRR